MHAALVRALFEKMRARVDLQYRLRGTTLYCSIVECPSPLGQISGGGGQAPPASPWFLRLCVELPIASYSLSDFREINLTERVVM